MTRKYGTTHMYAHLMKSYGVFVERPVEMDMVLSTEAYEGSVTPSVSLTFGVGKFSISTYVNVYVEKDKYQDDTNRVFLRVAHDDYPDKDWIIYNEAFVPEVFGEGFMENKIFEVLGKIDPAYADRNGIIKQFLPPRFNASDLGSVFQKATSQYGYVSMRLNNYKRGNDVRFKIVLGDSVGRVHSASEGKFTLGERVPVIRDRLGAFLAHATSKYTYSGKVHKL